MFELLSFQSLKFETIKVWEKIRGVSLAKNITFLHTIFRDLFPKELYHLNGFNFSQVIALIWSECHKLLPVKYSSYISPNHVE